jgi:hypothetical protein
MMGAAEFSAPNPSAAGAVMPTSASALLPFGPVQNVGLFSSHWLDVRLALELDWAERNDEAGHVLERLAESWKVQRGRVERYGDEHGLEEGFKQPVLRELGWKLKYQTWLQAREPDYALFLDDAALDAALAAGRNDDGFWKTAAVVADAKAWDVSLDKPTGTQARREFPPQQIEWYLDRSGLEWGVLTNGRLWRLVPRRLGPHQRRFQTYFQVDLAKILDDWAAPTKDIHERSEQFRDFLRFYLFFSPAGFTETMRRKSLIRRAAEGSSEYRLSVGEGLKWQAFNALTYCIQGFLAHAPNGLNPDEHLLLCRGQSFILLCRLLFALFAEDRALLPYKVNALYTDNHSLGRLRDEVAQRLDGVGRGGDDFDRASTRIWDDLQSLFDLIDGGKARYGVPAYNGGLFDADAHPFLADKKVPDWHLARVIDGLSRARDPRRPDLGLSRVDYRDLAIQHLGGIYEGLLELHPQMATVRMVVYARQAKGVREEKVLPESHPKPAGFEETDVAYPVGSVYLITDKGERRASGSYYTPDHIVNLIVDQTLGPLCTKLHQALQREAEAVEKRRAAADGPARAALAAELDQLHQEYSDRVLTLRVVDPAMGSGHFLLRACQYLAEEIASSPFTAAGPGGEESALNYWKRRVVETCLFGADLNPLAVELAKLALWLETVASDRPLTFLDHHLRHGNSLVGARVARLGALPSQPDLLTTAFDREFAGKLPALLEPLAEIRRLSSDSRVAVKKKQAAFDAFGRAAAPYRAAADLWCAAATGVAVPTDKYHAALDVIDKPARFKKLAAEDWFQAAVAAARSGLACFHWELDFPEAFVGDDGLLALPGFDAVIGNPPYEVLSELESGQDLAALRAFINTEPAYAPSRRGKNNLYKLFVCRALDLLAEGGRLGFITPMALLGDDQAADLRRELVYRGAFTAVEAFPQKDDPARRVFPEAKLSTAVFTYQKGTAAAVADRLFRAHVHPGRTVEADSPGLALTTAELPLYDPSNFTVVSCAQEDWDMATRIMRSGRMDRLGKYAESFQGEVNETNDRKTGRISYDSRSGPEVIRGAHLCLYAIREASQGTAVFLVRDKFLDRGPEPDPDLKAFHHKKARVGFQRKSPQNNFRRLVAAGIEPGTFLLESISYIPEHRCSLDLLFVLALLNSKLSDWYFRLGSTNAMVSEYQINNLPCPVFSEEVGTDEAALQSKAQAALATGRPDEVLDLLRPLLAAPPFSPAVREAVVAAVRRIIELEAARGTIARTERSALDPAAQPYQDLIDRLFYGMAGLTDDEVRGLGERYARML